MTVQAPSLSKSVSERLKGGVKATERKGGGGLGLGFKHRRVKEKTLKLQGTTVFHKTLNIKIPESMSLKFY